MCNFVMLLFIGVEIFEFVCCYYFLFYSLNFFMNVMNIQIRVLEVRDLSLSGCECVKNLCYDLFGYGV